jgi:phospholipid/cholesterol/gamma-HCH transport system substrate-binding protein
MKISKETKIGLTGVVALIILFLGINFLKGASLFSSPNTYFIAFSNAKGLSKNSKVYADGYDVGIVSGLHYNFDKPGQVIVEISVDRGLRIPKGSSAKLDEGMLGGCTLNMLMATNLTEAYHPGDTIKGSDAGGLMAKASDMMPQIEKVIARVDTLLAALNTLAADSSLPAILQNAEQLTANLNQSAKDLNRLLKNDIPKMTNTFDQAGQHVTQLTDHLNQLNLQATLDSVNTTISSVHQMMTLMQDPEGSLGQFMHNPDLFNNLNHTVQSADSLVTDLKRNPKRYVHFYVFGKKR